MVNYRNSYEKLAVLSTRLSGNHDKDANWWKNFTRQLKDIGELRNECCHSGTFFDSEKLSKLISLIFDLRSIESVFLFSDIDESISHSSAIPR